MVDSKAELQYKKCITGDNEVMILKAKPEMIQVEQKDKILNVDGLFGSPRKTLEVEVIKPTKSSNEKKF
jgi:hypothetical protein